jgi:nucleoside-diphosphate-sugar epimerase
MCFRAATDERARTSYIPPPMKRILVTGASGQLGSELVPALRDAYGDAHVVASDINLPDQADTGAGPFILLDCLDAKAVAAAAHEYQIDTIFHLAALLSAAAERAPQRAYDINIRTLMNVLEVSRERSCALFTPSSIGAFGPGTPRDPAPQDTLQRPTTMYGITKVAGEMLCDYYALRFGVDTRGVRYPGLISYVTPPGGGTTDYAVEIFYHALEHGHYTCFLSADTQLDMMYMPDAVRAAMELMEADAGRLEHRNAFNITAMQLTPARLAAAIQEHIAGFRISYDVDPVRQGIADSWPLRLDDGAARAEWGWAPRYDANAMTRDMIEQLSARIGKRP